MSDLKQQDYLALERLITARLINILEKNDNLDENQKEEIYSILKNIQVNNLTEEQWNHIILHGSFLLTDIVSEILEFLPKKDCISKDSAIALALSELKLVLDKSYKLYQDIGKKVL